MQPIWSPAIIPITVHVPDHRVEEFYIHFGEFMSDTPDPDAPTNVASGTIPGWVQSDKALSIAASLLDEVSLPGRSVLMQMVRLTGDETKRFRAEEIADAIGHPMGKSVVAGTLGGVGKAIRRAGLPMYRTPRGNSWHYIWDWDGDSYSMTPEVAQVLRAAAHHRA